MSPAGKEKFLLGIHTHGSLTDYRVSFEHTKYLGQYTTTIITAVSPRDAHAKATQIVTDAGLPWKVLSVPTEAT